MAWRLRGWTQSRRALRALDRIAVALEAQTALLTRMASVVAPVPVEPQELVGTGPSFLDEQEQGRVLDFVRRTHEATGQVPTDDQILAWLADELTQDAVGPRP